MKVKKVICGFMDIETKEIETELREAAEKRKIELDLVHRYRKEGILEYVKEHPEYQTVILQEVLQRSSPYSAEDLIKITDDRHVNVIVSLNQNHHGTDYMEKLYTAGIYNAIFECDAYAETIIDLVIQGRTRKEARKYYGISSYMEKEDVIKQEDKKSDDRKNHSISFFSFIKRKENKKMNREADLGDLEGGIYQYQNGSWKKV